jgi:hypothetical protein
MKKLFLVALILTIVLPLSAVTYLKTTGPTTLWSGDTLKGNTTLTASPIFVVSPFAYLHAWVYTANAADSVSYRLWYRFALSPSDTFCVPNDTLGDGVSSTIIRIDDRSWHYIAIDLPDTKPPYMQILATSHATAHGNRARIWIKVYFSP